MVDRVKDWIETCGFLQLVTSFTRSWKNQADSLLDQVWSNNPDRILKIYNETRGASDHNVVGALISLKNIKSGGMNIVKRKWKNFDETKCKQMFKDTKWDDVMSEMNVNVANYLLESKIRHILDTCAPMCTVQTRTSYLSWLTNSTKDEMKSRDSARITARNSGLSEHWDLYKARRNRCTALQKHDKNEYLKNMFDCIETEKDTAKLFSKTKKLLGWKQIGGPTSLKQDGVILRKQDEIANCQMEYYTTKIDKIKNLLPRVNIDPLHILRKKFDRWMPAGGMPTFSMLSVTQGEVASMINDLKKSHAYGTDLLDAYTIKLGGGALIPPITHVINLSLSSTEFPARWKIARILPLKKGKDMDATNPGSYRPVSQLPVIGKLAERTVQKQLLKYLELNKMISPNHHAYHDLHNTTTALLNLTEEIATSIDNNEIMTTMNIDLTAAFDCVPHLLLIEKLKFYGLDGNAIKWIQSYLSSRSSFVSVGSANSKIKPTLQGVPQGSVIGPLLYLVFVNEMTSVAEDDFCKNIVHEQTEQLFSEECRECGSFPMYADDGQFQYCSNNRSKNQEMIENNFWKIKNYLNANGLMINESKTCLVEFMSHQKRSKTTGIPPDLTITETVTDRNGRKTTQDKLITDSGGCRLLGLNLKNCQTWDGHLTSGQKPLLPSLRRQLGLLSRITNRLSKAARLKLMNAFVLSRLSYMICIWGNSSKSQVMKVQVVLNTAARLVTGWTKTTRQQDLLDGCGWLSVDELTEYHTLCQVWRIIKWGAPSLMRSKLEQIEDNRLRTKQPRLKMTVDTFRCKGVTKWNKLPSHLREIQTLSGFKKQLKLWLKQRRNEDFEDNEEDALNDNEDDAPQDNEDERLQDNNLDNPTGPDQDRQD